MQYKPKKRALIYSGPKTGKSTSLATVPGSLWIADIDQQLGSFMKLWKQLKGHYKDLEIADVQVADKGMNADDLAMAKFNKIRDTIWDPPKGFDFYAIDSYTTVGVHVTHACVGIGDRDYNMQTNTELVSYVTDFFWQCANRVDSYDAWFIATMHERWQEIKDGLSDPNAKSWRDKKEILAPDVASSARTTIPANINFVWHCERARRVVKGPGKAKNTSASVFRMRGTPNIMASTTGYDDVVDETELADFKQILSKMDLLPTRGRKKTTKKTSRRR
jgi:hypothetical protein